MAFPSHIKYIIGIDEAGRGPWAGPVSVGAVLTPVGYEEPLAFRDSKKLSEKKREILFEELKNKHSDKELTCAVSMTSALHIDRYGIVSAVRIAMKRALQKLDADPDECMVLLDGGLKAPMEYALQETHIKGDEKFYAIALASVIAKVTRDRHMIALARKYPLYGFDVHKGYGTKAHREAIEAYGCIDVHRKTFLHLTFMEEGI